MSMAQCALSPPLLRAYLPERMNALYEQIFSNSDLFDRVICNLIPPLTGSQSYQLRQMCSLDGHASGKVKAHTKEMFCIKVCVVQARGVNKNFKQTLQERIAFLAGLEVSPTVPFDIGKPLPSYKGKLYGQVSDCSYWITRIHFMHACNARIKRLLCSLADAKTPWKSYDDLKSDKLAWAACEAHLQHTQRTVRSGHGFKAACARLVVVHALKLQLKALGDAQEKALLQIVDSQPHDYVLSTDVVLVPEIVARLRKEQRCAIDESLRRSAQMQDDNQRKNRRKEQLFIATQCAKGEPLNRGVFALVASKRHAEDWIDGRLSKMPKVRVSSEGLIGLTHAA